MDEDSNCEWLNKNRTQEASQVDKQDNLTHNWSSRDTRRNCFVTFLIPGHCGCEGPASLTQPPVRATITPPV